MFNVYVVFVGISTVGNGDGSDLTLIIEVPTQLKSSESLRVVYEAPLNPEMQDGTNDFHGTMKTNYDSAKDVMTISKICIYSKVNTFNSIQKVGRVGERGIRLSNITLSITLLSSTLSVEFI